MPAAQIKEKMAQEAGANWHYQEAIENTARLWNISPQSIRRTMAILRSGGRRLTLPVQSGELAVSSAAEKLQEPRRELGN